MAKARPKLTLQEMELQLGSTVTLPRTTEDWFFSDLSPVPLNVYDLTEIELRACNIPQSAEERAFAQSLLQDTGKFRIIDMGQCKIAISRNSDFGYYVFAAEVKYPGVFQLNLLLSASEVASILHFRNLRPNATSGLGPVMSRFPKEVREKIFDFAVPHGTWMSQDLENSKFNFPARLGDPSGFYFPLNSFGLLQVNRQIRQEALPIAFRKTFFRTDDLDDLTKFLIAVGDIGRDNLKSLEFTWQGRSVLENTTLSTAAQSIDLSPITLPTLHAGRFSGLLRQCKRLKLVRILFDGDIIEDIDSTKYDPYTGAAQLEPIQSIDIVEICGIDYQPLPQHVFGRLLKDKLRTRNQENDCRAST